MSHYSSIRLNMTFARVCSLHYEKFSDGTVKCIEDEIPFEIPDGWAWARLVSLSECVTDGDHQPPPQTSVGIPFLVISNVASGELSFSNIRYVSKEYYDSLSPFRKAKAGDLLFTVTGSYGIPIPVNTNTPFCFQRHIAIIRPCIIDHQYLAAILGSMYIKKLCDEKATGIAQKTVDLSTLRNFLLPVAPTSEQERILEVVNNALETLSKTKLSADALKENALRVKAKILDLAIRGKLVPQDPADEPASVLLERIRVDKEEQIKAGKIKRDKKESFIFRSEDNSYYEKIGDEVRCIDSEIPYTIPGTWTWCRGWSCFKEQEAVTPPAGSFLYIDIDSIDNTRHVIARPKTLDGADAPSRARRRIQTGSVVFSLVRPYLENIALVSDAHSGGIASTGFYVCTSEGMMIPSYMFLLMTSRYVVHGLNQFMKGDNSPSINKNDIEQWLYPIPPICEQQKISKAVDHFFELIKKIEQSLN